MNSSRNAALVALVRGAGMSCSEAVCLRLEDVRGLRAIEVWRGTANVCRSRTVELGDDVFGVVNTWVRECMWADDEYLFDLEPSGAQRIVRRLAGDRPGARVD